jgi:hypothetical protein
LDEAEELADVFLSRDEVDVANVESGLFGEEGAKEGSRGNHRLRAAFSSMYTGPESGPPGSIFGNPGGGDHRGGEPVVRSEVLESSDSAVRS